MEYERTDDGEIQADFARRVGQVLVQYDQWRQQVPTVEQYESTLTIALLQSLLTMCQELIRKKRVAPELQGVIQLANRPLEKQPSQLGLSSDCVLESWPSERGLTYREVIDCLRNALSHPGPQNNCRFPRTGFTSVPGPTGQIASYEFTQSSWVNSTGSDLKDLYFSTDDLPPAKLLKDLKYWAKNHEVEGIDVRQNRGRWQPVRYGEPFLPVLKLRVPVGALRVFTIGLSDYLSEPVRSESREALGRPQRWAV